MTRTKAQKTKLAKAMANTKYANKDARYYPTLDEVKRWHKTINREVFGNKLKNVLELEVRRRHGCFGECWGRQDKNDEFYVTISFNTWFESKKHFIECVVHEMVHQYQWEYHNNMTHGETFFAWEPKLEKYGMKLREKQ